VLPGGRAALAAIIKEAGVSLRRITWGDGSSSPDDYNVIHDGKAVGRIYRMTSTGRETWQ
jgi:hypothetical protein